MYPTYDKIDVVIIGGGTAGAIAAITAARHGLKTLIIEQSGFLGGTQTGALVTPMMSILIDNEPIISQISDEIQKRLHEEGNGIGLWFNPEALKFILEDMYLNSNGKILYFTSFVDAIKENNRIKHIIIHNKSGLMKVEASIFIDCTGDADVAAKVGIPFEAGKKDSGLNQPMSVRFEVGNINLTRFGSFLKELGQKENTSPKDLYGAHTSDKKGVLSPIFEEGLKDNILQKVDAKYFQFFSIPGKPGVLGFNCPEIIEDIDGTDINHLTQAMVKSRQSIKRYMEFMKKKFPGFEDAYLLMVAPMVGVRESRRIIGKYQLTCEDVITHKKFKDGIAKCNYYIDIHNMSSKEKIELEKLKLENKSLGEKYFEIPFRCCITNDVDNLLVAGRCISADFRAQSALRIQQVCRALGEACGHASYIAIKNNMSPNNIKGESIRALMNI